MPNLDVVVEGVTSKDYTITHVKDDETVVEGKDVFVEDASYAAVIAGKPNCAAVTEERTQDVGTFVISKGDSETGLKVVNDYSGNYELTFKNGEFKILPLPLDNVYDDENHPQISEDFEVEVRLEKSEYVYDGTEKTPMFTVVYTDGTTSYTIPQEQYQYYYTKAEENAQSTVKAPDEYSVYVYKANGKNNLKDGHTTRGEFEITKIPVTVRIIMSTESQPASDVLGHRVFDGTTTISDVKYTTQLLYKPSEDGGYEQIPETESLKELKEMLADSGDEEYEALLDALVLPSANAGQYSLGTGENAIDITALNEYLAEKIDDDTHEYCLDDVIYRGGYIVEKASLDNAEIEMIDSVEYNGEYQTPEVTVTLTIDGKEIPVTEDDLLVTYSNNKAVTPSDEAAVATINVSPNGNFTLNEAKRNTFKITPKVITVTSSLALKDKIYDGNANMEIIGDYDATDFVTDEDATLKFTYDNEEILKDNNTISVSDKNVGKKTATITASIEGDDKYNYTLEVADEDEGDGLLNMPVPSYPISAEIELTGEITAKDVSVVSTLALADKVYDGTKVMDVTGDVSTDDFIENDDVQISGTSLTADVENANVGDKTYTFNLSLTGDAAKNYNLKTTSVTATGKIEAIKTVDMHRLYNPNSGEHFYTANVAEKDNLVAAGWKYEGIGWKAPVTSNTPVYRLYNKNSGEHHYTRNVAERDMLVAAGWKNEGIGWYSDDNEGVALYRQYNPNAKTGTHNYTASKSENDWLISLGWKGEGIGWYGVK